MQIVRPVVSTVGGVGNRVRDLGRLREVATILVRHGLGLLVAGVDVPGLPPRAERTLHTTPARALQAIEELGPTFVKLGQVLSTRPDLLPEAYCDAFTQLQDDVANLPFAHMEEQLDASLPEGWRDELEVDPEPLATASIAQVHRATLRGQAVVLKVRRPGVGRVVRADLAILYFLARRLLVEYPESKSFDPLGVLVQFERSLKSELDFQSEAANMAKFRVNFPPTDERVHIPDVYDDYTTETVLCMEFLDGIKMREARAAGCDMKLVGDRYLSVAYDMLFVHGLFHGDLHPGNVVVLPGDVIGLLDFGMVGTLTQEMRDYVVSIMFALQRGDYRTIARLFYEIAIKDERLDYQAIERETIEVMQKHWSGGSVKDMQIGPFILDLAGRATRHGARVPSSYTMFFKAIMTSEGLAKSLIEEIDPISAIRPYFQRMLAERLSPEALRQELFYNAFTLSSLVKRLPVSVTQLLDDFDAQRIRFQVQQLADPEVEAGRERRLNRALLGAGALTCTVCGTASLIWGPVAATVVLYVLGGLLAGAVALGMWRSRQPPRSPR